jgi:1-acyl-sn-glycerol-3-phosphate acyltransferase
VAIEAHVPVQPVVVSGAINVLNKKSWFPRSYETIELAFCKPIDCTGLNIEDRGKLAIRTRQVIVDELARITPPKESSHVTAHA